MSNFLHPLTPLPPNTRSINRNRLCQLQNTPKRPCPHRARGPSPEADSSSHSASCSGALTTTALLLPLPTPTHAVHSPLGSQSKLFKNGNQVVLYSCAKYLPLERGIKPKPVFPGSKGTCDLVPISVSPSSTPTRTAHPQPHWPFCASDSPRSFPALSRHTGWSF